MKEIKFIYPGLEEIDNMSCKELALLLKKIQIYEDYIRYKVRQHIQR